jgi:hypothetical protein
MFQTKVVEIIKTHILCSIFFPENRAVYEIKWKNIVAGQATDDNVVHAYCMLDAGYLTLKQTLI